MIAKKISSEILTDDNHYFFSMLSDRFAPLNDIWAKNLEERFGYKFKPIFVLSFRHNKLFEDENYIVLNEKLELIRKSSRLAKNIMDLSIYQEDLNQQFSKSPEIKHLIEELIKKQNRVFVLPFTSVWLKPLNENVTILGPDPEISARYDAKTTHHQVFEKLGLPQVKTAIYKNIKELRTKQKTFPFFLSATYSSGGIESKAIFTPNDLESFYDNLRPVNRNNELIASAYIDDIILAPNVNAIVTGPNTTTVICVSDQILRSNAYLGNIYPSKVSKKYLKQIIDATEKVGGYLGSQGFRGLFGLDFLITKSGNCYPTDINPRRQGGYFCNVMASKRDVIDLELGLVLGEKLPAISYDDFQADYFWAHSKLSPYYANTKIMAEFCDGEPTHPFKKIGSTHKAIYYPKNHTLILGNPGFYLATGHDYEKLKNKLYKEVEITISTSYDLYE